MEEKDNRLDEQKAPLKNTDNAFVQVDKDGHPVMPKDNAADKKDEEKPKAKNKADRPLL